ncbi:MAG: FapA family protein [Lachnospiraceae bacterium]|nr:FapA family protein [Lachnospiraceae bacterium]
MGQTNAYMQIEIADSNAICHYYPAVDGGRPLQVKEAESYLDAHDITGYDKMEFHRLISSSEPGELNLGVCPNIDFAEVMYSKISLDKMKITCWFYPPSLEGPHMNAKDIMAELNRKGVVFGIDQEKILEFLDQHYYNTEYVFAMGKQPVIGKDAKIEYFFNTNPSLKPKHLDDGSVDYRDLNTICEVQKGDLLARLIPEEKGENGKDITGREIPTRTVKSTRLSYGKNITANETKTEIFSAVTGHVTLVGGQVFVSDVYEVPADVDNSTGNIDYNGNVHIGGSVRGGFTVRATGDVIVDGVVEDAFIECDGQVIVKCGIHGMNKGVIDAKGNVIIQFIENAKVFSGGYIETGSILYSEVNASEDILVTDKKGFITGGMIRAGGKVESRIIGSSMGAMTKIEVGMAPDKKEQYATLQKSIMMLSQKINKINPIVKTYQDYLKAGKALDKKNLMYLNNMMVELRENKKKLEDDRMIFNSLHQELLNSKHAKVVITRDIFPGVNITISDISITTKDKRSYCMFEKKNGEICITNL